MNDVRELVENGTVAFALEAADELDRRAELAKSMLSAIPAIVAEERIEQHNAIYDAEAKRWSRLANAVRQSATALETLEARVKVLEEALERFLIEAVEINETQGRDFVMSDVTEQARAALLKQLSGDGKP